ERGIKRIGKGRKSVMRQAGRYRGMEKPTFASAPRTREIGRDPLPRKALWPAAHPRRIKGRTHGRTDQHRRNIQIPLAKERRSLIAPRSSTHGENLMRVLQGPLDALSRWPTGRAAASI